MDGTAMYLGIEFQAGDNTGLSIMSAGIEDLPDLIIPVELGDITTCTDWKRATSCFGNENFLVLNVETGVLYHGNISVAIFKDNEKTVTQVSFSARRLDREELAQIARENKGLLQWLLQDSPAYKPVSVGETIAMIMRSGLELVGEKHEKFKGIVGEIADSYENLYRKANGAPPSIEEVRARVNKAYNIDISRLVEESGKENTRFIPGSNPVRV